MVDRVAVLSGAGDHRDKLLVFGSQHFCNFYLDFGVQPKLRLGSFRRQLCVAVN